MVMQKLLRIDDQQSPEELNQKPTQQTYNRLDVLSISGRDRPAFADFRAPRRIHEFHKSHNAKSIVATELTLSSGDEWASFEAPMSVPSWHGRTAVITQKLELNPLGVWTDQDLRSLHEQINQQ